MSQYALAFMGLPGGLEWIVVGLVALLIFGRRLPGAARSMGASIVQFKQGLRDTVEGVTAEVEEAARLSEPAVEPAD